MKKLMVIAITVLLCAEINANTTALSCDWANTTLNENLTLAEKMRCILSNGFWMEQRQEKEENVLIQFHYSGRMDWITSTLSGQTSYQYGSWKVNFSEEIPTLIWDNETGNTRQQFIIEQSSKGLMLKDLATQNTFFLKHQTLNDKEAAKATALKVVGNWSNATYPFDISKAKKRGTKKAMKGAYLKVDFAEDGTFIKKYGDAKTDLIQYGRWELSKNGQFIFMHSDNKISIAKIEHLDLDELVLEFTLECDKKAAFSTQQKSFVFIR